MMSGLLDLTSIPFPNALVLYENNGHPLTAVVQKNSGSKVLLLNYSGSELELSVNRLYVVPGKIPNGPKETKINYLKELLEKAKALANDLDLEKLWLKVKTNEIEHTTKNLCELVFGVDDTLHNLATRIALISNQLYFKRSKNGFTPRNESTIENLKLEQQARAKRKELREEFVEILRERFEKPGAIPKQHQDHIALLEELATSSALGQRVNDAKEIVELCQEKLGLSLGAHWEERAFSLLERSHLITPLTDISHFKTQPLKEFPQEIEDQINRLPTVSTPQSWQEDYTQIEAFTIDDITTKDMDDALSIEKNASGCQLGIHITDVASFIAPASLIDDEAKKRATSIYCPSRVFNMFPDVISEELLSLKAGEVRSTLSCLVELAADFSIISWKLQPTIIKVTKRITYDEVDQILEVDAPAWEPEGIFSFNAKIHLLSQIAHAFEKKRVEQGAKRVNRPDSILSVDSSGKVSFREIDEAGPGRSLVGELMILANRLSAEFARDNQIPYLYRAQPKTESQPTNENYDRTQKGPAADYHARLKLKRSMTSTTPQGHASLGLNVYAQVTSPIRRYADILNQRQLIAFLKKEALPYSAAELIRIAEQLEEPLGHARTVSRESRKFWTLRYIEQLLPSNPIFHGTVLRTDLRHPLIEVAELFTTFIIPMKKRKQIGDVVKVSVQKVSAKEDLIQFCEV